MSDVHVQFSNPPIIETGLNVTLMAPLLTREAVKSIVAAIDPAFVRFAVVEDPAKMWQGERFKRNENQFLSLINAPEKNAVIFSYNVKPPYLSWDSFITPARETFIKIIRLLNATKIQAVGVRTVDKFVVPQGPGTSVGSILKSALSNVAGMPIPGIAEFYLRDTSFYREYNLFVRTIRLTQPTGKGLPPDIILDTDVFSMTSLVVNDLSAFDDTLKRIHEVRYKVFVGSVNDAYLEKCK